jgi:hypothetical protein
MRKDLRIPNCLARKLLNLNVISLALHVHMDM